MGNIPARWAARLLRIDFGLLHQIVDDMVRRGASGLLAREHPGCAIVVCGCLAQRDGEKLLSTGARLVIGNARRGEVVSLLEEAVEKG